MEVRERMGTSVRTMVKMTTQTWGPASGHGEGDYGSMEERRTSTRVSTRIIDRVVTTCAIMVYSSV